MGSWPRPQSLLSAWLGEAGIDPQGGRGGGAWGQRSCGAVAGRQAIVRWQPRASAALRSHHSPGGLPVAPAKGLALRSQSPAGRGARLARDPARSTTTEADPEAAELALNGGGVCTMEAAAQREVGQRPGLWQQHGCGRARGRRRKRRSQGGSSASGLIPGHRLHSLSCGDIGGQSQLWVWTWLCSRQNPRPDLNATRISISEPNFPAQAQFCI